MLRELGLFILQKRGLWRDLRTSSLCLKKGFKEEGGRLFSRVKGKGLQSIRKDI